MLQYPNIGFQGRDKFVLAHARNRATREFTASVEPGTEAWLFESPELNEWLNSDSSALMWLHGSPWCGKSVLAKQMVKKKMPTPRSQRPVVLCDFFFEPTMTRYLECEEVPPDDQEALRCILWQLCRYSDGIGAAKTLRLQNNVPNSFDEKLSRSHQDALLQYGADGVLVSKLRDRVADNYPTFLHSTNKLWRTFIDFSQSAEADVICVLDGLGKRNQALLRLIMKHFSGSAKKTNPHIKFMVCSRLAVPPIDSGMRFRSLVRLDFARRRKRALVTQIHVQERDLRQALCATIEAKAKFRQDEREVKLLRELKQCPNFFLYYITQELINKDYMEYARVFDIQKLMSAAPWQLENLIRTAFGEYKEAAFLQEMDKKGAIHELLRPEGLFEWPVKPARKAT